MAYAEMWLDVVQNMTNDTSTNDTFKLCCFMASTYHFCQGAQMLQKSHEQSGTQSIIHRVSLRRLDIAIIVVAVIPAHHGSSDCSPRLGRTSCHQPESRSAFQARCTAALKTAMFSSAGLLVH